MVLDFPKSFPDPSMARFRVVCANVVVIITPESCKDGFDLKNTRSKFLLVFFRQLSRPQSVNFWP